MARTYYEILGVAPDASTEEIELAYRERLKESHPDVSDDPDAGDKTKALITAKDVLTDEDERARYDRLGHDQYVDQTGAGTGSESKTPSETTDDQTTTDGSTGHTKTDTTASEARSARTTTDTRQQRHRQQTTRATWSNGGGATGTDAETGRSWSRRRYTISETQTDPLRYRLLPSGQAVILFAATFLFYPVLLWATLFPSFPVLVNLVVGCCLLGMVIYTQSYPAIGLLVYGAWLVLLPASLSTVGVRLTTPRVAIGLVVTGLACGLTLLTRAVVRR
jgi:hypothetical protein